MKSIFSDKINSPVSKSSESDLSSLSIIIIVLDPSYYEEHLLRQNQTTCVEIVRDGINFIIIMAKPGSRDLLAKRQNPRPSRSSTFHAKAIFSPFFLFFWAHFFCSKILVPSVLCHLPCVLKSVLGTALDPWAIFTSYKLSMSYHLLTSCPVFVTFQSIFIYHVTSLAKRLRLCWLDVMSNEWSVVSKSHQSHILIPFLVLHISTLISKVHNHQLSRFFTSYQPCKVKDFCIPWKAVFSLHYWLRWPMRS